ncbi:drug:proton antiporter [Rhodobacterales bacterium 52_120_T64]|nr:drug:proton antiporter [Rhodobacterales bacterium 52_120_T64]
MSVVFRIAFRELRGGLAGFRIFLLCLALGVMAITTVGSVRMAIEEGLEAESDAILGGDASMQFTYRMANDVELAWINDNATQVSHIVDFRSMVLFDDGDTHERSLVQIKGIDAKYPLYGDVGLNVDMPLSAALAVTGGLPGLVAERALFERLDLEVGDILRLGTKDFQLRAVLTNEPDGAALGFSLGPRVIVEIAALDGSGLLSAGTLFNSHYRLIFPDGMDGAMIGKEANALFGQSGMSWSDSSNSTPTLSRFVERIGSFLIIIGLAGLAVGGVGVSAAVRAYLSSKNETIGVLKTLGASRGTVFGIYLAQIGVLAVLGVAIGLILGAGIPVLAGPLLAEQLPVPANFTVYWEPIFEAAIYGMLTALIFTLWPLSRAIDIRAAGLFRDEIDEGRKLPRWYYLVVIIGLVALLVGLAAWFAAVPKLALWSAFGVIVALGTLATTARGTKFIAGRMARSRLVRGRPALRSALGAVGGPGGETASVILSLGLGLSVLATVGQIDANMQTAISDELPAVAPAYFFLDILNDQRDEFVEIVLTNEDVAKIETAPMLQGMITKVNGQPAKNVFGDHWAIEGDRGITYSAIPPNGVELTEGEWWAEDYTGPPLMSFTAHDAEELGLVIGDQITFNVLGRDITSTITNFRDVEWSGMGINFLMVLNPAALENAPHSHIATVYAEPEAEGALLREVADAFPNITAIRVGDAIDKVTDALTGIASAIRWGAAATLVTGFVVLIGAAAAGERRRIYEAAILKTLGATRARILASFALRAAILGAAAGLIAIAFGGVAGYAVMTFVMDVNFTFEVVSAAAIVIGGALASLLAGLAFALRPLNARPAQVLRSRE